jgi:hypothetical protein
MADEWARSRGMLFMEASAKTKLGIAQVFNEVVQKVKGKYIRIWGRSLTSFFIFSHRYWKILRCYQTHVLPSPEVDLLVGVRTLADRKAVGAANNLESA